MRRVLIVLASLEPGGAERAILTLVQHLPRERFELHLGLIRAHGRLLEEVPEHVGVHDLGAGRVRRAGPSILRLVRRLRPDVLAATLGHVNLALLALRPLLPRGLPLVVREANTVSMLLAGARWPRVWALGYRVLYPRADTIVCNARAMLDDLASGFGIPRERLRYIPNPVDVERIRRAAQRGGSPYAGRGPHVIGVGRLVPQKGFDRLVDAFASFAGDFPEAQLWLLGEGPERDALASRTRCRGLGARVHLVGRVADPERWLRHADVFALGSRFEGLPNALLEALACGTPSIAFDAPGGARDVLADLEGGELVPDGDVEAFARGLARLARAQPARRPELPPRFRLEPAVQAYAELFEGS
ncbi:MAG: glycosyltransferase [Myxococcota bacterium]